MRQESEYHNRKMTTKTNRINLDDRLKRSRKRGGENSGQSSCGCRSTAPVCPGPDSPREIMRFLVGMKTFPVVHSLIIH